MDNIFFNGFFDFDKTQWMLFFITIVMIVFIGKVMDIIHNDLNEIKQLLGKQD